MKADVTQHRALLELAEIDAELTRLSHRAATLAEQQHYQKVHDDYRSAQDRLGALSIALADIDESIVRYESEISGVRQREDRDRALLDAGTVEAKHLQELQHELETLSRRQTSLEDSLLEVMEQREQLAAQYAAQVAHSESLETDLNAARQARDDAQAEINHQCDRANARRAELIEEVVPELSRIYEQRRTASGVGAGVLLGGRCGACRIELNRGELARISSADADEVLQCPECHAILLRVNEFGR